MADLTNKPHGRRIFLAGAVRHIERDRRVEIQYVPDEARAAEALRAEMIRVERREGVRA